MRINIYIFYKFVILYVYKKMYKHAQQLFKILIVLLTLVSLYMLAHKIYYKNYQQVYSWHFPMLLAICIETFV